MKPFLYLTKRNFINYIKSFKHKPSKAFPLAFFIFMIVMMCLSFSLGEGDIESDLRTVIMNIIEYIP